MSWQNYIEHQLTGTGQVSKGAIFGLDGTLWAASENFSISKQEIDAIINGFTNQARAQSDGIVVNGTRYIVLRILDEQSMYAKNGATGLCCCLLSQRCVIVSYYDDTITPGGCNAVTEMLADYLRESMAPVEPEPGAYIKG